MENEPTTRAPYYKLREFAPKALMILERYRASDPTLALFEATLPAAATAFMATYDATHSYVMRRRRKSTAQERAVKHLWERVDVWLAFLVRDVPAFDRSEYVTDVTRAVQVIAAAERLVAFVAGRTEEQPTLAYATQLTSDVSDALAKAQHDWVDARTSLNEQQVRQADTRKLALAFERELDAFRDVLGRIVGESNTDYQSLRLVRRSKSERGVAVQAVVATDNEQEAESLPTPLPNGVDPHPEVGSTH